MIRPQTTLIALLILIASITLTVNGLAVMSIDLGTEFMKIAIVKPGIPMEIVLNKESRRKTPVIIAIKGQDREFGDAAISRSSKLPSTSYMFLRDLVGKSLDNPVIEQYLKRFPFYKLKTDAHSGELVFEHDSATNYTVEELLAMLFKKAREYATDFAEQSVDSAVITVPPYFTQAERRAIKRACELANIKLLQLMNDNTAVALNYGVFRRKDFNTTGSTFLFYDMGAQSTTCTLATFNIVKVKDSGYLEEVPQLTVKAVAFDRNLGGLEFQIRLRDYLARKFNEQHSNIDIFQNARALTKLFREAERAKQVLSANTDYTAQVEGLVDEIDFKHRLTREQFEQLCGDLFERVKRPVEEVLHSSGVTLAEVQQVFLFGGSTRIPRVQEELIKALGGLELGKSLNTDEAAAMGAVYQAAALSKGYRVKKFLVKDTNQYPINVQFERHPDSIGTAIENNSDQKMVDRTLFARQNLYPNRKVMTFNRHTDDFSFDVHYGDLNFLSATDKRALGRQELSRIRVTGARTAYDKHKETSESKGIKAHFRLDDNCLLVLDRVEFVFERKENETEANSSKSDDDDDTSTLSKLGSKISSFFSSRSNSGSDETTNTTNPSSTEGNEDTTPPPVLNTTETENNTANADETKNNTDENQKNNNNETVTNTTTTNNTTTPRSPKMIIIREPIEFHEELLDYADPSAEAHANSVKKLIDMDKHDRELVALSTAKNNLESFIYDIRDKLEHDIKFKASATADDQTKISDKLSEVDAWLWDDGLDADVKTLKTKLDELKKLTNPLTLRVRESDLRPIKLQELKEALNLTQHFAGASRALFSTKEEADQPFTESEIKSLEKLVKETYTWREYVLAELAKILPTDTPKYLSSDIDEKIVTLKREMNYLLGKAQRFVPKPKTTTTTPKVTINNDTTTQEEQPSTSTASTTTESSFVEQEEKKSSDSDETKTPSEDDHPEL